MLHNLQIMQSFAPAAELLRDLCAAQLHEGNVSSLVARGRVGMPASPEGILPSRLYQPSPICHIVFDIRVRLALEFSHCIVSKTSVL